MNVNHTLMNAVGWIFICLFVLAESTIRRETESLNKIPRENSFHSNSFKNSKRVHNKTERQTLLREFVLGDFSPYRDDTPHEENSDEEISDDNENAVPTSQKEDVNLAVIPNILTKSEINEQKTDKLAKGITTKLGNKKNEGDKIRHKKSKYHYEQKWEKRKNHSTISLLKENIRDRNFRKRGNIDHFRPEENKKSIKLKNAKTLKSGYPFEYYDNFAFGNSLADNYDGVNDKTGNYFSLDENFYDSDEGYDMDERLWRENNNAITNKIRFQEGNTFPLRNLRTKSYETAETSTGNPVRKFKTGHFITTKQVEQKGNLNRNRNTKIRENKLEQKDQSEENIPNSYMGNIKRDKNNDMEHKNKHLTEDYRENMGITNSPEKCNGNCTIARSSKNVTSQMVEKDTKTPKFHASLKNVKEDREVSKLETDVTLHNWMSQEKRKLGNVNEMLIKKLNRTKHSNTIKKYSLFQQMLNTPVKSIVNFFRKYIFGNKDPGDLLLKDIWKVPNTRTINKTDFKINAMERNLNRTKTKNKPKVSNKVNIKTILRNKLKSKLSTKTFKPKSTEETNPVTRTFSSNKHEGSLKGSDAFIELIDVLIDGRMLDKNKYLSEAYKKSFIMPKLKESNHFPGKNIFVNSKASDIKQDSKLPYFIPLRQNAEISSDRKSKKYSLLEKTPTDFNAKRSGIYYPEESVTPRTDVTLNNNLHPTSDNNYQSKYQNFYDNRETYFQYPWNVAENHLGTQNNKPSPQYTIPKANQQENPNYLTTSTEKQRQYYRQYLALQETAREPPPYTFQIYGDYHLPKGTPWNKLTSTKDKSKYGSKYKGIFGNKDSDLQSSCTDLGKQDYIEFCPKGWVSFKQFCFFLDEEEHGWSEIPNICTGKNSKMAMPKSQDVIGFLVDKLSSKKQYTKPFFVGLRKIDEEWKWIDDTPLSEGLSDEIESNFHSCAVIQEGSLRKMPCDFKAGFICEMKTGIEASRVLTFGDSLTKGYYHGGKSYHPYGTKLEVLLNKDDHRCFALDISGKNGEQSDHMLQRISDYLNMKQRTYDWVLILAGTNDLLVTDNSSDKIADQIVIMHEVVHARGAKSIVITIPEIYCERTTCKNVKQRRKAVNKHLRIYAAAARSKAYLSDLALRISAHQLSLEDRQEFWEPSGVHLKRKGYDKMAEIIFKDLMESIESPIE